MVVPEHERLPDDAMMTPRERRLADRAQRQFTAGEYDKLDKTVNHLVSVGRRRLGKNVVPEWDGNQINDTWTVETRQALDLSDAQFVGLRDQEREDIRNLEDVVKAMDRYQGNLNRLLTHLQRTLFEGTSNLERLMAYFTRYP